MNIDLSQFTGVFFEETAEHLAEMEHLLLAIDTDTPDADQLNSIFRAAHSIKGSAGVFGFQALSSVTHVLEGLLDKLRNGSMSLQPGMIDSFLNAVDTLKDIATAYRTGQAPDLAAAKQICEQLEKFIRAPQQTAAIADSSYGLFIEPTEPETVYGFFSAAPLPVAAADNEFGFFNDNPGSPTSESGYGLFEPLAAEANPLAQYVDGVLNPASETAPLATGATTLPPTPSVASSSASNRSASAPAITPPVASQPDSRALPRSSELRHTSAAGPTSAMAASGASPGKKTDIPIESTSIRVNTEKIDQIINLVGELVITQSMLAQTAADYQHASAERLQDRLNTLERNTRDLQDAVMSIRMMPVSFIFNRFPRVVRDLAQKLSKQVELIIEGETTELDKGLIEKLADPLTHLVRNSIDHGIEMPARRIELGKAEKGSIRLAAFQRSGSIVIEVSDDGGGLNREKILAKASERGLPVSQDMADSDVWQLIFAPGFSTAEQVTDVSGRGVGMDVVKRNIQEIGGRIEIQSNEGLGSTMSIRLPLTLAILDGMVVAVGGERYIIPLIFIKESFQPHESSIRSISGNEKVVMVRGDYIPLHALHEHMAVEPRFSNATQGLLVMLENETGKFALLVDELLGQQQVVVKSIESNYRRIDGVAGATIMGDGRVALILNVEQLILRYSQPSLTREINAESKRGAA